MYILTNDLYQQLNKYHQILVYGAGNYAKFAYLFLKKVGFRDKIGAFIVTDLAENGDIDGIRLKSVNEIVDFDAKKCVVLIAVSNKYSETIVCTLKKFNFTQMIKLEDYILTEGTLREVSDKKFLDCVIGQCILNRADITIDYNQEEKKIREQILQRKQKRIDKNTIVFISSYLLPRTVKIINALINREYKIIILEYGHYNMLAKEELLSYNLEFFQCQDICEVFYKALQYTPLVYYYDPMWGDRVCPEIMIRHKKVFGKVVIALYDVLNDGYVRVTEDQKLAERYSLENADGIVWRWFSKEFLEKKKGFIFKGKSIQFLDYCTGYKIQNSESLRDELRICLILGNTYGLLDETIYANDGRYVEYARIDTIAKMLGERNDCVFHVFMGESSEEDRNRFAILERMYSNFKVFYGTKHHRMIQKISEYDYGCFLYTGGVDIPEFETADNLFYGSTHNNAMSNKYFDYLDAGLPIIATRPKKLCGYLDQFGVIVKMDLSNINIDYLKDNKGVYKKKVECAREELLIDKQIQRMITFLEGL